MIKLIWKGFDLDGMDYAVHALIDEIEIDVRQIVEDCVDFALEEFTRILEAAVTTEGKKRASGRGGHPGRNDTVKMSADARAAIENGMDDSVVGTWGWTENLEDYYVYQEYGTLENYDPEIQEGPEPSNENTGVPAMRALQTSYIKAREMLRERLRDYGLEID